MFDFLKAQSGRLFLISLIVFLSWIGYSVYKQQHLYLHTDGKPTEAIITNVVPGKCPRRGRHGPPRDPFNCIQFTLGLTFKTDEGQIYERKIYGDIVDTYGAQSKYKANDRIQILYDPKNPKIIIEKNNYGWLSTVILIFLINLLFIVTAVRNPELSENSRLKFWY